MEVSVFRLVIDVEFGLHVAEHPIGKQLEVTAHIVHVNRRSPKDNVGPVVVSQCRCRIVFSETASYIPALRA